MSQAVRETYAPRRFRRLGLWKTDGARLKAYGIEAADGSLDADAVTAARRLVDAERLSPKTLGFVILHRGDEAVWLLLHWWMPGGILAQRLWRRDLPDGTQFRPIDRPLMACVWELVPIGFERDAYVATIMNGAQPQDYLARTLPEGSF